MAVETEPPGGDAVAIASDEELLRRFRPVFRWDSQSRFRPLSAEAIVANPGNVLCRFRRVVAGDAGRELTLASLSRDRGRWLRRWDRLEEAAPPLDDARRLQADPRFADTVHVEVIRHEDRVYLRYWSFFYYAAETLFGFLRREGDWRVVEVALDGASGDAVAVTCGDAATAIRGDVDDVQWEPGAGGSRHPVIYVAPFSHAYSFARGPRLTPNGTFDVPDGAVKGALPRLADLGPWATWPGRWGSQSRSPRSPWRRRRFTRPGRFMRKATKYRAWPHRLARAIAVRVTPAAPVVASVALDRDTLVIDWWQERSLLRRGRWLLVTAHAGATAPADAERIVRIRSRQADLRMVLPSPDAPDLVVRASSFNLLRLRSPVTEVAGPFPAAPAAAGATAPREEWPPRVWRVFHRRLLTELVRHGALTIDQLVERRFHVLELPLDRVELVALVDSARRHGLVRPIEHAQRPDGSSAADVEWAPTDEGRKLAHGPFRWAASGLAAVPPVLAIALVSQVLWPLVDEFDWPVIALAGLAAVQAVVLATILLHRLVRGAAPHAIASRWSRHAVALPFLNRAYGKRGFVPSAALMLGGYGGYAALVALGTTELLSAVGLAAGLAGQVWFQLSLTRGMREARREARAGRSARRRAARH